MVDRLFFFCFKMGQVCLASSRIQSFGSNIESILHLSGNIFQVLNNEVLVWKVCNITLATCHLVSIVFVSGIVRDLWGRWMRDSSSTRGEGGHATAGEWTNSS